jgi:hypothetical protein
VKIAKRRPTELILAHAHAAGCLDVTEQRRVVEPAGFGDAPYFQAA